VLPHISSASPPGPYLPGVSKGLIPSSLLALWRQRVQTLAVHPLATFTVCISYGVRGRIIIYLLPAVGQKLYPLRFKILKARTGEKRRKKRNIFHTPPSAHTSLGGE